MTNIKVIIDEYETGKACKMYTFFLNDEVESEFNKFLDEIDSTAGITNELDKLIVVLNDGVLEINGAKERYFRPEGKMGDRVCALPVLSTKLRLYCIRISDEILIIGNGGVKTSKTYQDDPHLNNCVEILQKIDAKLKDMERSNDIAYFKKTILDFPIELSINIRNHE